MIVGLALFFLSNSGCSSDSVQSQVAAMNSSNIKRVANLFGAWQNSHGGQGPKDVESIKTFAEGIPPDALQNMKIDSAKLDALFISERDGKPFKIKFGAVRPPMAPHIPVVFEEKGTDGKKQVAWTNAQVRDVDDAEYQQLWGEKSPAPVSGPPGGENAGGDTAKQPATK
jgi:hypothetical protein